MIIEAVECACQEGEVYADGSSPSFYTDEKKAVYMYLKLKPKALKGLKQVQMGINLPTLSSYNLYYGVHLNSLHILSVR